MAYFSRLLRRNRSNIRNTINIDDIGRHGGARKDELTILDIVLVELTNIRWDISLRNRSRDFRGEKLLASASCDLS